jgi:hypothetical protein
MLERSIRERSSSLWLLVWENRSPLRLFSDMPYVLGHPKAVTCQGLEVFRGRWMSGKKLNYDGGIIQVAS